MKTMAYTRAVLTTRTNHADTLTASGQLSFVNDFDMLFKTNDSNTNGTSHDLIIKLPIGRTSPQATLPAS